MKIKILIAFLALNGIINAQGTWTQKANFAGIVRNDAVGFSIGNKGYIGIGNQSSNLYLDFWEWDQITNVWTQKANFGGVARFAAVGFSIGTKGYVGTGYDLTQTCYNDFWEWDQATNVWTQKANFAGSARYYSVGFSISNKGYIVNGDTVAGNPLTGKKDFWEYDPTLDSWTQKANFAGGKRTGAIGSSIGVKGYIGTASGNSHDDFWEWNQATNVWTQKANFGGTRRDFAVGFSIGKKVYVGTGEDSTGLTNHFWEWDQATNVWMQKTNFGGTTRYYAVGFSIGYFGYIGTGLSNSGNTRDFWEYTPDSTTGVNELENKISVSVFPNPSRGIITIKSSDPSTSLRMTSIEITNVLGEKVHSSLNNPRLTSYEIDLRKQPKGIYFYKIEGENKNTATGKIIIE